MYSFSVTKNKENNKKKTDKKLEGHSGMLFVNQLEYSIVVFVYSSP